MGRQGFTLTEVLIAVTLVGILTASAITNYTIAVRRARWDAARETLTAIYNGEWKYRDTVSATSIFHAPAAGNAPAPGAQCPAAPGHIACVNEWRNNLFIDPPNGITVAGVPAPPTRYVIATPTPTTFTATATFAGQTQIVDENKSFTGTWTRP